MQCPSCGPFFVVYSSSGERSKARLGFCWPGFAESSRRVDRLPLTAGFGARSKGRAIRGSPTLFISDLRLEERCDQHDPNQGRLARHILFSRHGRRGDRRHDNSEGIAKDDKKTDRLQTICRLSSVREVRFGSHSAKMAAPAIESFLKSTPLAPSSTPLYPPFNLARKSASTAASSGPSFSRSSRNSPSIPVAMRSASLPSR